MLVNAGQADKGTIFNKNIDEFRAIYSEIETLEKKRAETQGVITSNMGAFSTLVSASQQDTAKQQFYQQLDQAIGYYNEVMNMLHQANQFYTQLSDYLTKLF